MPANKRAFTYAEAGRRHFRIRIGCVSISIRVPGNSKVRPGVLGKELLDGLGLISFPKISGSRGLHVVVPIRVEPDADPVLKFAEPVAKLAAEHPKN
jgi:hypothetical protein